MKRRIVFSYLFLIGLVLLAVGVPLVRALTTIERTALERDLERDAVVVAAQVEDLMSDNPPNEAVIRSIASEYNRRSGARVVIVDENGRALADNDTEPGRSFATRPELIAALSGRVGAMERYSATLKQRYLFIAVPIESGGVRHGAVRLSYSTKERDARVRSKMTRVLAVSVLGLGIAIAVGVSLATSIVRPVKALQRAARAIGSGNLDARAKVHATGEIGTLTRDFNEMAARLAELVRNGENYVADASHQLRSPLTALRLRLEALEYASPEDAEAHRDAALEELTRLSRTIDGLLNLSAPDRIGAPEHRHDLALLANDAVARWNPLAEERGITIVVDATRPVVARVTPERVAHVLDNLIANAIDFTPSEGTITILCRADRDRSSVHVRDQGPGLTPEQRQRAFDRFWRASTRRTDLSGSGLGLAIARKLVVADGGGIELHEAPGGGLEARVAYSPR